MEHVGHPIDTPCEQRRAETGNHSDHHRQHQPTTKVVEIDPSDELDQTREKAGTLRLHGWFLGGPQLCAAYGRRAGDLDEH